MPPVGSVPVSLDSPELELPRLTLVEHAARLLQQFGDGNHGWQKFAFPRGCMARISIPAGKWELKTDCDARYEVGGPCIRSDGRFYKRLAAKAQHEGGLELEMDGVNRTHLAIAPAGPMPEGCTIRLSYLGPL